MPDDLRPRWIETPEGVSDAADLCVRASRFALDTEADSMHSYFHKVCLIQLTADGENMVIDPLALEPVELAPLWEVVGDPGVPVLMHGADYDIRVLDRDYGARVRGLVDTQIMAQLLGEEKTGLAALLEKELDIGLDKRYQRADWGRRPLKVAQVDYAAADTAYLEELAVRLRARLQELGRFSWAEEEFGKLESVRHNPTEPDLAAFERIKGARAFRGPQRDRIFTLHGWREGRARSQDLPPFKILGNKALIAMAQEPPKDLKSLGEVDGVGPLAVRRWGRDLLRILLRPKSAPERVQPERSPAPEAAVRRRLKAVLAARDAKAESLGLQAGLLCPKGCAESVAAKQPPCSSPEDLAGAGLTGWRLDVLGGDFLTAIVDA